MDFPPLLFTAEQQQPVDFRTPGRAHHHSPLRESGTISSARRSATPPGSVHTDTTPPRPPPMTRLQDITMTGAVHRPSGQARRPARFVTHPSRLLLVPAADAEPLSGSSPLGAAAGFPEQSAAAAAAPQQQQQQHASAQQQAEDTWVTVYGFSPDDLPLVLKEFQRCGDILQWGTFGASSQSNFMHIQYQNKYGAQRAQLRSGEQLNSSLIIGVKQLEPKHRAVVAAWAGRADGSPGPRVKAASLRPYRVEVPAAQVLPSRSRTWAEKVGQYVFGL